MNEAQLMRLMKKLTDQTVLGELLRPLTYALEKVRFHPAIFSALNMTNFITLGFLRHLQGIKTLREQIQSLLHCLPESEHQVPLPRSTWSDALASSHRLAVTRGVLAPLADQAKGILPDRLKDIPYLGGRAVYAIDGTYQAESTHYWRCTPKQGGHDNPKGHGLLSFYDIRLGCPIDVQVETQSRHETAILQDYGRHPSARTRERGVLWIVDRAFIHADYWNTMKRKLKSTMITRMKSSLSVEQRFEQEIQNTPMNRGVLRDERIVLRSSDAPWRLITFRSEAGKQILFLTNEFKLEAGVIAFLYLRRWDEEKCFDTWKNDFSQTKAWGKSRLAIENQVCLAIILSLLVAMFLHNKAGCLGLEDEKALRKQDQRRQKKDLSVSMPSWFKTRFRHTSKISRQVLRFLKCCFHKKASLTLCQNQLHPMLLAYL